MAFKLAEGYVELSPRGFEAVNTAIGGVKSNLNSLAAPATFFSNTMSSMIGMTLGILRSPADG